MMNEKKLSPAERFVNALVENAGEFGVELGDEEAARLGDYYELTMRWNARLHLVAPCSPEEFATRHVLESLLALRFIDAGASLVDVGSGAGLPAVPCLIVQEDLTATLFESSQKKAVFLREALRAVGASGRATVVAERFEKTDAPAADVLTCRAIERFGEILPALLGWSKQVEKLLLFGGDSVGEGLEQAGRVYTPFRVPGSERRTVFVVRRV
ncbi:MAG TPA: RsmG family class I SAM-dependent methyltransferase [Pyrinomonadaceae bacterium]|jgi:16S rRNA (guanine527-N7)-methyltransferase